MPLYDFECEPCAYYTEIHQSMFSPSLLECPVCGQKTLKKVFLNPPYISVRGEPTTIGQMAEKNAKKMGKYEIQDKTKEDKQGKGLTKEQKEKRNQHQKITAMTPKQKLKWIREGN
jgi:putative FmdB family regulatory protein